ncbi:MAG: RNA polymerase-associated protein RapA [Verrucomicrobia bacterium]|nr:RNA polymerase-associated protein RapA [Verrucomicrobiota bacterium]
MPFNFQPGQRWISETEPELGLGTVLRVSDRTVTVVFGASAETREYARDNAPLRRVRFRVGDSLRGRDGSELTAESVIERQGLLVYAGQGRAWPEAELSDAISFNRPEERLLAGQVDPPRSFDLRAAALEHQHRRRKSGVRGFLGGRIDLIPHQLYIASEVARRLVPRVLLADEVGLGKTIEACLILHRLIQTGRAQRILILVPESLVHQWFVELLRRFNLWFHIFDEESCAAIEAAHPEANPFEDDQLVLTSISLLSGNERRLQQAFDAGWDLLVTDEAHHLGWSPESVSPEYAAVERLAGKVPGLLLLTATPEQLGMASHFARLRLLDPDRFHDLEAFIREAEHYRDVARLAQRLTARQAFAPRDIRLLAQVMSDTESNVCTRLKAITDGDEARRAELMEALLDQHGTGRVMFRNTRATIRGFPDRVAHLYSLPAPAVDADLWIALADEFAADVHPAAALRFEPDLVDDPRIAWLAGLLQREAPSKILLICRTRAKAEAIEAALRLRIDVKQALFHEGLSLVQRDRSAAWFAEEDGARLLIASEIGSEGRNFQFAHHLVLFDLPPGPELLEQRIGRLDRIGQHSEIQVHVPFVAGSPQEALARWFDEGLNTFERNLHGGHELWERFGARVRDLAQDFHETRDATRIELDRLIAETRLAREAVATRLEQGQDRLLELNSFRADTATGLVRAIGINDHDRALDAFMLEVFEHYAIQVEELGPRTFLLGSAQVFADCFPGLPAVGLTVTCDRRQALSREDMQFLTWDHPLVTGALDLLLGSEQGNSSFARWPDRKTAGVYLETIHVLECIAPAPLHVDRFLPATPIRVLVDHQGEDLGGTLAAGKLSGLLKDGDAHPLLDRPALREELLPALLQKSRAIAAEQVAGIVARAQAQMSAQLDREITRLEALRKVNRSVRPEEIQLLVEQRSKLARHLTDARLRLDAIRLIHRGPG